VAITVRPAAPDDFPAVAALLAELGRPDVLGVPEEVEHRRRFRTWLETPGQFAFVAEDGDEIVGFIDLMLLPRLNFTVPEAWVPDLIVTEGARSRGAGAALLSTAETLAQDRGAFALTLDSANWRTRAHAFYLREGMIDAGKRFVRVLVDMGWPPPPPDERP
jgi:GNAT superfamily N-acetyltransferase